MSEAVWWTRWLVFCLFTYVVCIRRIFLRPRKWNGSSFFRKVAARCTVPKLYNKSTTSIWMELESFQKSQPSPLGVLDALRNFTRYVHCVIQIIAQVSCIMSFIEGGSVTKMNNRHVFFCPSPLRVSGLKSYSRTSGGTNHHRQSVSDVKNGAISTEPRGRLMNNPHGTCEWNGMCFSLFLIHNAQNILLYEATIRSGHLKIK